MGAVQYVLVLFFIFISIDIKSVKSDDLSPIPPDRAAVDAWFNQNVKPTSELLNPVLQTAEKNRKEIKVGPFGQFKTINEALKSVPPGNTGRVVINIAKGVYNERIRIERTKPFITLFGEPGGTIIQAAGTAKQYGTYDSATVDVQGDYFIAAHITFKNTAPRPTKKDAGAQSSAGAQAVAFRIGGDMAAFYSCKFYGYQDTLLDEKGRHLFKSCYIEGTIDYIFGSGKSIYLSSQIHTLAQDWTTVITAQGKQEANEDSGFSFVHCSVTGEKPGVTFLGRAWQEMAEVAFSYSTISNSITPVAWDAFNKPLKFAFSEFDNTGPGADLKARAPFTKKLDPVGAKKYLNLGYIQASKWLVPPGSPGASSRAEPAAKPDEASIGSSGAEPAKPGGAPIGSSGDTPAKPPPK